MSIAHTHLRAARRKPGFLAAVLHRASGVALAIFLPMHFIALGTALGGADKLESFLAITHYWPVRVAEWGLVSALALHMALGLRVLAIEFLSLRTRTGALVGACCAAAIAVGLAFLLSGA
ncbi:MAG: succinate dehydrogenase, cytochrome b556 subunit [Rhizobiales bacterium 24-66-13]|jgi:fumarate reductase subunit D|uniref:succinate dehydrogenase, cytochrome b556 subunit n=1 Tax=Roseixanthobacter finlandensis TaxID=3119922 RepID=UPI000BDCBE69|nr:MAG: succinate dehydrogenase, cytochrome b556 subunit [Rhizobiales bacterium 35-66-30]OYZ72674.1 MAG: succinate dehydrogenase, cytochrome b556 subunit [Rhizobiales bacterium 24-66-13]OZB02572.1 MAG: succinate dehydrogenase, cytochrome b556 subunit [Rhizobiales bacterium 39-66-18]HQS10827.1 succinate dehydrogenase, cytochrome b556 subunit [Xanthobacteraceae bacterium]HQS49079.1 succinate dehydrogenase, cytochrome b556 subunit [Xanthobacteraceae bacterium]